jgi:hypothetical protein
LRQGRHWLAVGLSATALLPLPAALMGEVLKDCLMAGALAAAASLALLGERSKALRLAALLLIVFAATLRFNAFLAGVPLVLVVAGPRCWATWGRLCLTGLVATVVLLSAMPVANRMLGAAHSDVELSLVIFDLAGITTRTGHDVLPSSGTTNTAPIIAGQMGHVFMVGRSAVPDQLRYRAQGRPCAAYQPLWLSGRADPGAPDRLCRAPADALEHCHAVSGQGHGRSPGPARMRAQ